MLMALLLPDPCDSNCPEEFKQRALNILPRVQGSVGAGDGELRKELLRFIGDFANWENAANPAFLEAARGLIRAAHGKERPLVVDPFAGGGSIPLEALRIGCDASATDLNPVACLIEKATLEDIPRGGPELPDRIRRIGTEVIAAAGMELAEFYPTAPDGSKAITYLWARTIICDSCGAEIPLVRSFWLSDKGKRKRALRYRVEKTKGQPSSLVFETFEPKNESEVPAGTVNRAKATCRCCNVVTAPARVRAQLASQEGGAEVVFDAKGRRTGGAQILCVVSVGNGSGRFYRVPTSNDYLGVWKARLRLENGDLHPPSEPLPPQGSLGFRVQPYGITNWGQLFNVRQKLGLLILAREIASRAGTDEPVGHFLALCLGKTADLSNSGTRWKPGAECPVGLFSSPKVPPIWDWAEAVLTSESSGSFYSACERTAHTIEASLSFEFLAGTALVADAAKIPLPTEEAEVWFTDPPYYNAIPYATLSDFFFVWLKKALPNSSLLRDPFDSSNHLTPKLREAIQDETQMAEDGKSKNEAFFERKMAAAFAEGRRVLREGGISSIIFAHQTTEGWEALLGAIVSEKWVITASWPIATEMQSRVRARESAALATSVHLVCRPRLDDAPIGDWADVLRELPLRVGDWIERLQAEGIKGADLVFACIGPAMEIYSRYRRVEDAEGREIPLGGDPSAPEPYKRGFLAYVWETVGRLALEEVLGTAEARARNGAAGALEEDARLTALFLWTLQTTDANFSSEAESDGDDEPEEGDEEEAKPKKKKAGYNLIYDVARRFAQPLGIHLDKWEGRIIEKEKGVVRLLPVSERGSQLFGEADAAAISRRIEADVKASRNYSFAFMQDVGTAPEIKARGRGSKGAKRAATVVPEAPVPQQVTTLDRLHAAMLLQRGGQTNGLRAMLREETQRGPDFLRLANALSRLYPKDSEEKRLLDAMLLAVPR
jgi:hypothetical protein